MDPVHVQLHFDTVFSASMPNAELLSGQDDPFICEQMTLPVGEASRLARLRVAMFDVSHVAIMWLIAPAVRATSELWARHDGGRSVDDTLRAFPRKNSPENDVLTSYSSFGQKQYWDTYTLLT